MLMIYTLEVASLAKRPSCVCVIDSRMKDMPSILNFFYAIFTCTELPLMPLKTEREIIRGLLLTWRRWEAVEALES